MLFSGNYMVYVEENGEFKIPESLDRQLKVGAEYEVFYSIDHKNDEGESIWLLSFVFDRSYYEDHEKPFASGTITEDKKLRVPEEYRKVMKGECLLLGVVKALELTIFPLEAFLLDDDELENAGNIII